ncbi:MAG: NifB/NifX family molybdenum-iron cluster-binding protein [Dehalococcoidales bacterium]|nr:NifB/NifX family molybdenum-iron cluster-binding protein [Dehalococcoidales bacterium]
MKIAISSAGTTLEAMVDPRFGRCPYFVYVDPETLQFEASENSNAASGGAGIAAAQSIAARGVEAVLTGNCGPNAYQVLSAAGIKVVTGVSGKIKDIIQDYKIGKYQAGSQPNVSGHFGMGQGKGNEGKGRECSR